MDVAGRGADSDRSSEDAPPASSRLRAGRVVLVVLVAVGALLVFGFGLSAVRVVAALAACYLLFRVGFVVVGSFARPIPPPPPPGELRQVRIRYRCSLCGTEVRMTVANDEVPEPPRHCQEDMQLEAPIIE